MFVVSSGRFDIANALTIGGPRYGIFIATEELLEAYDEAELRAIAAHELAHLARRDTIVQSAFLLAGLSVAGGLVRISGRAPIGVVSALATVIVTVFVEQALQRRAEFLADDVTAEYDVEAYRRVVRRFRRPPEERCRLWRLLATHPHPERRLARLDERDPQRRS